MSTRSKDLIIDVLHHVATSGRVAMSEKHFDPTQQDTITFHKNSASRPPAQSAFVNLFSDAKPNGFGFSQPLVLAVAEGMIADDVTLKEVRNTSDLLLRAELVENLLWELCALQVWSGRGDGARDTALEAMEALTDEELDAQDAACVEELDQCLAMFEEVMMDARGFSDGSDNEEGDESIREMRFSVRTADNVDIMCVVRVPEGYPLNPPLVMMQVRDGAACAPFTAESLKVLGSAARSGLMGAAVDVINGFEQLPCLMMLVSGLVNAAGGIAARVIEAKPEEVDSAAQRARDEKMKALQSNEKNRKEFVKHLTATKNHSGTQQQKKEQSVEEVVDDGDAFIMPQRVELSTVDTSHIKTEITRSEFLSKNRAIDEQLFEEWQHLREKGKLRHTRMSLPAMAARGTLREALAHHNVVVVSGETGSGKTTQVPQYLFEYMCEERTGSSANIVCTQPRRLAATAVALRVAEERDEDIGGTTGYSIRLENKVSAKTRILYCTTGIILRRMQADKFLGKVSHLVVDEIHERGVDTDFLLILLKELLTRRSDLKVVLMSATMNSELFSHYFGGAPVITIAGRTHPVDVVHLERILSMVHYVVEDYSPYAKSTGRGYQQQHRNSGGAAPAPQRNKNKKLFELSIDDDVDDDEIAEAADVKRIERDLIAADPTNASHLTAQVLGTLARMNLDVLNYELIERVISYICESYAFEGAILVFLPGMAEIQKCVEELKASPTVMRHCIVHNLHSSLESKDQQAIFKRPPRGKRKVVLGTNIMETSITIDDAVFVIDCGKHKENQYDARKSLSKLVTTTVSKANCRQRQGRAGRVRPGVCFRLFTSAQFARFDDHQLCEMHRVPLESLVLQIYTLNLGDEMEYLAKALSPPEEKAVRASVKVLTHLGALTKEKRLTSLGQHLANLPLDVKIGKMIIHGAVMHCVDPVLTIAACYSVRTPFIASAEDQAQVEAVRRAYAGGSASDSLAAWNVYRRWISIAEGDVHSVASRTFCRDNYVSLPTLIQIQAMKRQYERYLAEAGFLLMDTAHDVHQHQQHAPHRGRQTQHFLFDAYRTLDGMVFESGSHRYNTNSECSKVVVACLVAGLYPNVAKVTPKRMKPGAPPPPSHRTQGHLRIATFDGSEVVIHPSSVAAKESTFAFPLLLYTDKIQTSMTFIREVTVVSPLHVILFGAAHSMDYKTAFGELVVDEVTAFKCAEEESMLLKSLKDQFDSALRMKINEPATKWETVSNNVVRAIVRLLKEEGGTMRSMVVAVPGQTPPLVVAAPDGGGGHGGAGGHVGSGGGGGGAATAPRATPSSNSGTNNAVPYHMRNRACFNCGNMGHVARICPNPAPPKERGAPTVRCFVCGQWHHPNECAHTRDPKVREKSLPC